MELSAQKRRNYADDYTVFDMKKQILNGGHGLRRRNLGPWTVTSKALWLTLLWTWMATPPQINEHFRLVTILPTADPRLDDHMGEAGHISTATAPDVIGTAQRRNVGATVQSKYVIQLPRTMSCAPA